MKYKDTEVSNSSGIAGVKQVDRGVNKGKWCAFFKGKDGLIFTGIPRETKPEAAIDLLGLNKTRVYL